MEEYKNPEFTSNDPNVNEDHIPESNAENEIQAEEADVSTHAADENESNAPERPVVPPYVPPYDPGRSYTYAKAPTENRGEYTYTQPSQPNTAPPRPPVDPSAARPTPPPARPERTGSPSSFTVNGNMENKDEQRSGEYRYVPPYSGVGANTPNPQRVYEPAPPMRPVEHGKKKEKTKTVRTFSTTALVFILIGAVLLSFASGMLGALLVEGGFEREVFTDDGGSDKPADDLVIDKADEDKDNGDDGDKELSGELEGSYDISDVCAVVSSSVVEISTEFNQTAYGYYQYVQEGAGSGVIISKDGYLLTNAHVITNAQNGKLADAIKVRLTSGEEYEAEIIGNDADSDIALLKVDGKDLSAATVGNSDSIKVGEQVIAVGNPLGELGGTVTSGIISATNREITVENNKMTLIQIDAAINPGNSGGGLFNTKGELIGIVNAKTTDVTVEGLGFAIPVNEAVSVAEELQEHGYVTGKTHIGISLADVTDSFTAYYNFHSQATGVYIVMVQEGYNDKVLKRGDRITAIDDNEITSSEDVKEIVSDSEVGDKLTFTVSREGKLIDVEVTCYEYVPEGDVSFDNK